MQSVRLPCGTAHRPCGPTCAIDRRAKLEILSDMKILLKYLLTAVLTAVVFASYALRLEPIKYGNMQNWYTRDIKESAIIGGDTKTLYEIAPAGHTTGNKAYRNLGGSPWATSNVYAKVSGVVKSSCAVTPATVNGQKMAKVQAKMEQVKALGIINLDVRWSARYSSVRFPSLSLPPRRRSARCRWVCLTQNALWLWYSTIRWICLM